MGKDPAVLFYTSDFLSGTITFTNEEIGAYIKLLCIQREQGHIERDIFDAICGHPMPKVLKKFSIDENGMLFQHRMDEEIRKRNNYINAQTENGKKGGRPKKEKTHGFDLGLAKENPIGNENIYTTDNSNTSRDREIAKREREERKQLISSIVDYLNTKTGKRFRSDTQGTTKYINARLNEGYTYEDFIKVIDTKTSEWKNTDFEKFLCPDTLFNSEKFPKYLNQKGEKTDDEDWWTKQWNAGCTNV